MQVQRVGSPNAAIAAQVILIDTRAKLYGLLAGDSGDRRRPRRDECDSADDGLILRPQASGRRPSASDQ